jgi:hypothetical protein
MEMGRAGGSGAKPSGHANGNGQFDALWAQLREQVKAELLAVVREAPAAIRY